VRPLVLTHLIPAPGSGAPAATTEQDSVDDVRAGGSAGEVVVGRDLSSVTIPSASEP
jgi:hypothetical protein